jgi:hypothetical protein
VNSLLHDVGIYEDARGFYRSFFGVIDAETFRTAACRVGRNSAAALLFDLYHGGALPLHRKRMNGVVADVWSSAEYPEDAMDPSLWVTLFRKNGYTNDGKAAAPLTEPVTLYRGAPDDLAMRMSWTSDIRIAERFAYGGIRGRRPGQVWTATVHPEGLLAYIGREIGRNESEFVVDPEWLAPVPLSGGAA